jgi:hypothetical protein
VLVDDIKSVAPARIALHGFVTRRMMLTMCPSCRAFKDKEEGVERLEKWNGGSSGGAFFIASMLRTPGPQHRPQRTRWGASLSRGAWPCTSIAPLGFPKTSRRAVLHECDVPGAPSGFVVSLFVSLQWGHMGCIAQL